MLKAAGAALVLLASILYGWQQKNALAGHVAQLYALKELLEMLSGEISYAKAPLPEAFTGIAKRQGGPFQEILLEIAGKLEDSSEGLDGIWRKTWEAHREKLLLSPEELKLIVELGKNLGYLDIQMQLGHIALYAGRLEGKIAKANGELAVKQKLYQYLSVTGALFLILILI